VAKAPRRGVVYPDLHFGGQGITVEQLRPNDNNVEHARAIHAVLLSAYAAQFERPNGSLPVGIVQEQLFNPDSKRKALKQQGRMSSHVSKYGSQYWCIRDPEDRRAMAGIAKISPRGLETDTPFGYFNDIAVRKEDQGKGLGLALAHAALKYGPAPQDQPLALDGFAGSRVNEWFEDERHMVARGMDEEGIQVGPNFNLPQVRYITESGMTVAGLVRAFEDNVPALTSGQFEIIV